MSRDTRPATDRNRQVESALDDRVLKALAAAWGMATDRQLVTGWYTGPDGVVHHGAENDAVTLQVHAPKVCK